MMEAGRPDGDRANHISGLDGLRGYAALVVMLSHGALIFPEIWLAHEGLAASWWGTIVMHSPLHILIAGEEAVRLFFGLSGLVLSIPFWGGKDPTYLAFVVRRFVRLYPPYAMAILFSVGLCMASSYHAVGGTSPWFAGYWRAGVGLRDTVFALTLIPSRFSYINTVIWSLLIEIKISLIFPLIIFCMRRLGRASFPLALVLAMAAGAANRMMSPAPIIGDVLSCLSYMVYFVAGAEIARNRSKLLKRWPFRSAVSSFFILGIGLVMLISNFLFPGPRQVYYVVSLFGSIVVVGIFACSLRVARLGEAPTGVFLGRISYSLYLVHFPILVAGVLLGTRYLPIIVLVPILYAICLSVASIYCAIVEEPFIRMSRTAGHLIKSRHIKKAESEAIVG